MDARGLRGRARLVREDRRGHLVGGLVRETPLEIHGVAHGLTPRDRLGRRLLGDERHAVERWEAALIGARPMGFRPPHRIDDAFHGGLRRPVLAEAVRRDEDREFLHVRAPQRLHAGGGDVARALRVVIRGASRADDDHERLAVVRGHTVGPPGAGLVLRDAIDDGLHRTRQPGRRATVAAERDDDRVDLTERRRADCTELHGPSSP